MGDTSSMGGDFLSAKDMKVGDKLKVFVVGEGKMQAADDTFKAAWLLDVEYNKRPITIRLGMRNVAAIRMKYGKDTKDWVGKELEFLVYMTNFQNKLGFQFVA